MRTRPLAFLLVLTTLAGCAPTEQQSLPRSTDAATQASNAPAAAKPACDHKINDKQALCGKVTKTRYEPAGFWPSAWSMTVKLDSGDTVVVEGEYGPTASEFNQLITVGDRVAYNVGDNDFLGTDELKVL